MARDSIPVIPDNAVLRRHEVCQGLDISEDTLDDLMNAERIPVHYISIGNPRFVWAEVVEAVKLFPNKMGRANLRAS